MHERYGVHQTLLKELHPQLHRHLEQEDISPKLYLMDW